MLASRWKIGAAILASGATLFWQREHLVNSSSFHLKRYPASAEYPHLTKHSNLMSRHLTPQLYAKLRDRITPSGYTIDDVIQVGVDNPGVAGRQYFGVSAGDEHSYKVFADLFDPLIETKFNFKPNDRQFHDFDLSKLRFPFETSTSFDLNKYVLSSRIRVTRNLSQLTFPTFTTRAERRQVEKHLKTVFDQFDGEFCRLSTIDEKKQENLINDGVFLFKPQTMSWLSAGVSRDWPDGRAVFVNKDKTLFAWINQKDHLRLISWSTNNSKIDLRQVLERFFENLVKVENSLKSNGISFAHDEHFGYLTTCPANIGTGLKYNVFLKLPNLTKDLRLPVLMKDLRLKMDEILDPDTDAFKNCIDVSNIDRIGKTEIEILQNVLNGVAKLIEIERHLEDGGKLDEYLTKSKQN